ncbi:MAG: alginate export family protein [Candidatus Didemnitutus sp.]|nr:alginate export family protein [Candidatus Didemnitutus sp.]
MKKFALFPLAVLAAAAGAAEPASLPDAVRQGKFSVNARLRYESVQQTNLLDANALTLRTRLGFTTAKFAGWQFSAEGENVSALDGDAYSQSGLNPAAGPRAVVGDPETTELNQLWLAYSSGQTTGALGRQKLTLDSHRFIGDVGWRQNQQTFDAFVLTDKSLPKTTLTYAYLDQVNRVFSRRHAQGRWESESHVLHASSTALPLGTLTGYAYLLDFENSAANSCATYGLSLVGSRKLSDTVTFTYRAEAATQSDYGSSTLNYSALYTYLEAGLAVKQGSFALGHEVLGSDHNVGFKTPLATLHAWNGWADMFLATPAAGLRDTYAKATANLPQAIALTAFYHRFESDSANTEFGTELDVMLTRKFGKHFTGTVKFADFRRDSLAFPNVRKVWLQVDFVY